jgi:ligand-binding SRPBCC domain-containing protein
MTQLTRSSRLAASSAKVWAHVTRMPAINLEMGPFLKMTFPHEAETMSLGDIDVELGTPIFRSWVLAGGVIPIERMDVTLVELEKGRRFVEQSKTLFMKRWRHERTVEDEGDGCTVTDRLTFEAPLAFVTPTVAMCIGSFFDHRHRVLKRTFGEL